MILNEQDMKELIAYTENDKWGYRDKETNEILIPAIYDDIDPSAEELDKKELYSLKDKQCIRLMILCK